MTGRPVAASRVARLVDTRRSIIVRDGWRCRGRVRRIAVACISNFLFPAICYFGSYKEYVGVSEGEVEFAFKVGAVGPALGGGDKV